MVPPDLPPSDLVNIKRYVTQVYDACADAVGEHAHVEVSERFARLAHKCLAAQYCPGQGRARVAGHFHHRVGSFEEISALGINIGERRVIPVLKLRGVSLSAGI